VELAERLLPYFLEAGLKADMDKLTAIAPALKDRIITLDDSVERCTFLFKEEIAHNKETLLIKDLEIEKTASILNETRNIINEIENWTVENIEEVLNSYMKAQGLSPRQYLSFLREAISGQRVTPPLFESMHVLGKNDVLKRMDEAASLIS
jgi:glutamyl-tRNA synthetase